MDRVLAAFLGRSLAPAGHVRGRTAVAGSESGARARFAWWRRHRVRTALLATLAAVALGGGTWVALRETSLSAVEDVSFEGLHGSQAPQIEAALRRAAHGMSTLGVARGALLAAVRPFPIVRGLRVSTSFPHGLRVAVLEQPPVAELVAAGTRTAAAGDGVVLGAGLLGPTLPTVRTASVAPLPGRRVADAQTRAELSVLGAAPATLLGWIASVAQGSEGIEATMRNGLRIYFGTAARPHAKWIAAARVLADPGSAGASYVDVRLPERPAAGGGSAGSGPSEVSVPLGASEPSAAALAARLDEAVAGGSATAVTGGPAQGMGAPTGSAAASGASAAGESGAAAQSAGEPSASGQSEPSSTAPSASTTTENSAGAGEASGSVSGG